MRRRDVISKPFRRLAAAFPALALFLAAWADSAGAGVGSQPTYAPLPPGYAAPPRQHRVFACDGSESTP